MADDILRALAHPVRLRMLNLMWPGPLSAAELARELAISHALASQHLRRLASAGLVELAEERVLRGGREKRYKTVHGSPLSDQRAGTAFLAEALAQGLRERAGRRDPEHPGVTTDGELWVSPEAWERYRRGLEMLGDALHAEARPAHSRGTVPVAVTVHAFRTRDEIRNATQDKTQDEIRNATQDKTRDEIRNATRDETRDEPGKAPREEARKAEEG